MRVSVIALAAAVGVASADVDIKKADELFAQGIALRESGSLEQSCAKFEESLFYNPQAIGTLLNVALCDEKLGRIASAVAKFSEARDRAKEQALDEYIKAAEEHIAALTPDLPYVTLTFAEPPARDTKIVIDDRVVPVEKIADIPVDPGERVIVVSAPDKLAYKTSIVIGKQQRKTVSIPRLAKSVTVKSSRRTIGLVTTVAGVTALATGIGLGFYANNKYEAQFTGAEDSPCLPGMGGAPPVCNQQGGSEAKAAHTLGTVGTVVGVVGGAAIVVGAYLWITAPSENKLEKRISVVPHVTPHEAGVFAVGRF